MDRLVVNFYDNRYLEMGFNRSGVIAKARMTGGSQFPAGINRSNLKI